MLALSCLLGARLEAGEAVRLRGFASASFSAASLSLMAATLSALRCDSGLRRDFLALSRSSVALVVATGTTAATPPSYRDESCAVALWRATNEIHALHRTCGRHPGGGG